jgi:hypothetical protein
MSEYLVVIEHEGDSWGAYCPDLPGVGVAGDTHPGTDCCSNDSRPGFRRMSRLSYQALAASR